MRIDEIENTEVDENNLTTAGERKELISKYVSLSARVFHNSHRLESIKIDINSWKKVSEEFFYKISRCIDKECFRKVDGAPGEYERVVQMYFNNLEEHIEKLEKELQKTRELGEEDLY